MARWWRAYEDAVDDPKVQRLPGDLFKAWFNLLCLASRNDGYLPPIEDIAFGLRMPEKKCGEVIEDLIDRGLIDEFEGRYMPHNWNGRQHKADCSTDRVQRFRERQSKRDETVSETQTETAPDTEQIQSRTEKRVSGGRDATRPAQSAEKFEEFKKAYPKRTGANPWKPARKHWDVAIKRGDDPDHIIAAVRACVGFDREKIGTEFIPRASTWLSEQRYADYQPTAPPAALGPPPGAPSDAELRARYARQERPREGVAEDAGQHQKPQGAGVFYEGEGAGGNVRRLCDEARQPGVSGVGGLLPQDRVGADLIPSGGDGAERGGEVDGANPVAPVVRH